MLKMSSKKLIVLIKSNPLINQGYLNPELINQSSRLIENIIPPPRTVICECELLLLGMSTILYNMASLLYKWNKRNKLIIKIIYSIIIINVFLILSVIFSRTNIF